MSTTPRPEQRFSGTLPAPKAISAPAPQSVITPKWMTVGEAARALEVTPRTVRNRCHSGELVWQWRFGRMRVSAASVRAILDTDSAQELDRLVAAKAR